MSLSFIFISTLCGFDFTTYIMSKKKSIIDKFDFTLIYVAKFWKPFLIIKVIISNLKVAVDKVIISNIIVPVDKVISKF